MDSETYLNRLRLDLDGFVACLDGDLSARIEHCGDWTLYDLADHLGRGNLWSAAAVREKRRDFTSPHGPQDRAELVPWFRDTCTTLLEVLDTDPDTEAWTFGPPNTVAFWQRRRCQEAVIHRWDAERATDIDGAIDPMIGADGIAEVFELMEPRQIRRGKATPPTHAVKLNATDAGTSWTYGPGEPVAEINGTAGLLLLMLWGRIPAESPGFRWDGDQAAGLQALASPLTP